MTVKSKKYKKEKDHSNMISVLLGLTALLIIGGFFSLNHFSMQEKEKIDAASSCRIKPKNVVAVLFDDTDPIDYTEQEETTNLLEKVADALPRYAKISLYTVSSYNRKKIKPFFEICNPGSETEASSFTENTKLVRAKHKKYKEVLKNKIQSLFTENSRKKSPIMEMSKFVVVDAFKNMEQSPSSSMNLIVLSDFLQNSDDFSLFKNGKSMNFQDYRKTFHWKKVKTNMKGINITYKIFVRKSAKQNKRLEDFWLNFYKNQQAEIKPVNDWGTR